MNLLLYKSETKYCAVTGDLARFIYKKTCSVPKGVLHVCEEHFFAKKKIRCRNNESLKLKKIVIYSNSKRLFLTKNKTRPVLDLISNLSKTDSR